VVLENLTLAIQPYREYYLAVLVLALSYLLARLIYVFFEKKLRFDANKKSYTLGDELLRKLEIPISLGIFLIGLFVVSKHILTILIPFTVLVSNVFFVLAVIWVVYSGLKFMNIVLRWHSRRDKKWSGSLFIVRKIVAVIIYIIAILIILSQLGVEITPLLASLGIGGLAIALALQSTLANYFAGLYITSDETIRVGDYIELDEKTKGFIDSITWRSTRIRTLIGNIIIIPNSKLSETVVTNYSEPRDELSIVVPVGVKYNSDLDKVEKVSMSVAKKLIKKDSHAIEDFEPLVRFTEFGKSSINFKIILRAYSYRDGLALRHNFMKALALRFRKEDIQFAFPAQSIYFENPLLVGKKSKISVRKRK